MLKVLTWNILANIYVDFSNLQRDYPTISADSLQEDRRWNRIMYWLNHLNCDVMFLQEVVPETHQRLVKSFPDYWVSPLFRHRAVDAAGACSGNVTMIRKALCRKPTHATHFFGHSWSATGVTRCDLGVFYNVHFDWERPQMRWEEAQGLVRHLSKVRGGLVIVAGDFNDNTPKLHRLFQHLNGAVDLSESTFLCWNSGIDHVYTNARIGSTKVWNDPIRHRVACFQRTIDEFGSDHNPVSVQIEWV